MKWVATTLALLLSLFTAIALEHTGTKSGVVISETKEVLPFAHVATTTGKFALTDEFGRFSIDDVHLNDTLYVTHLGFLPTVHVIKDFKPAELVLISAAIELNQVKITRSVKAINTITKVDVAKKPVNSSQEILAKVPGLIIGQHAGGGKAEQIFLRGFDIDHGTDVAISVDGMPVNMVSHAHGQGYADLHFVIPETIEGIDFGKGPYYSDQGNFNTAGYVNMKTKRKLDQSLVSLEYGQFNTLRALGMFNLLRKKKNQSAYIASELQLTDGPFRSSQNFNRINLMGKYNTRIGDDQLLTVQASYFTSKWDASGQIPTRAVEQGLISRFGAIDDTEGGQTHRINAAIEHLATIGEHTNITTNAFFSNYGFELYSNFTYFLNDSANGDQIKQFESRNIGGFQTTLSHHYHLNKGIITLRAGLGTRYDDVNDVELSHTANRDSLITPMSLGDVDETNVYGFVGTDFEFGDWLINPAVRLDFFKHDYHDKLATLYTNSSQQTIKPSPKLNIIYSPTSNWQLYLKSGMGFHTNDTRVVNAQNGQRILPSAYGADLGTIIKPTKNLYVNVAGWYLFLEQEFVYVGDEAVVEPSGQTQRLGVDLSVRYQPFKWLFLHADVNYAFARSVGTPNSESHIPLSAAFTSVGGLSVDFPIGIQGGLNYRWIGDRPANEDNSIIAKGYFVMDANLSYTWRKWTGSIIVQNLLNTEWNETQFATESRLRNETEGIEEIHFTPGTPFAIRGKVAVRF